MRSRFLQAFAEGVYRHRRAAGAGVLLLFALSVYWLATGHLGVNSSRHSVVDPDNVEQVRLMEFHERFGSLVDLIVVVSGDDAQAVRAAGQRVALSLTDHPLVDQIFYRVELETLAENGAYYLPFDDLQAIARNMGWVAKAMGEARPEGSIVVEGLPAVVSGLNERIDDFADGETTGLAAADPASDDLDAAVTLLSAVLEELHAWLVDETRDHLGLRSVFSGRDVGLSLDDEGYLVADQGRLLLLRITSRADILDEEYVLPLVQAVEETLEREVPDSLEWGITGIPAMVAEERAGLQRDLPLTSTLATLGCLLIFLIAYRSLRGALLVGLPLLIGLTWALALTAVLVGSLNLMTSVFAVILIGMGIDFSVHLFSRTRDELRAGRGSVEAMTCALVGTGPAVLTGAITSASAFAAMAFTDFRATRELGLIASTGLVLVMLASFILTVLLANRTGQEAPRQPRSIRRWQWPARASMPIIALSLVVTVVLVAMIRPIDFNFDVESYLPADCLPVQTAKLLEKHGVPALEFAVTQASSLEESRAQLEALQKLTGPDGVVDRIESIFDVLPPDLAVKEPLVQALRANAAKLPRLELLPATERDGAAFVQDLEGLLERVQDDLPYTLRNLGRGEIAERLEKVHPVLQRVVEAARNLHASDPAALDRRVARFEERLSRLSQQFGAFLYNQSGPLTPDVLPASLVSAFYQGPSGEQEAAFAVRVYPQGEPSDPVFLRRFTEALRTIDPEATGYTIAQNSFSVAVKEGLMDAAVWAFFAVLLLVAVDLRSLRDTAFAFLPLVAGGLWMVGLMNLFRMEYNFANVLAIPLIIGIGIDSGIHVIHRWREVGGDVGHALQTTGKAILVSSLTTMAAFGSLVFVSNRGGVTLGLTLLLGVGGCLVASLLLLPAVLDWYGRSRFADKAS